MFLKGEFLKIMNMKKIIKFIFNSEYRFLVKGANGYYKEMSDEEYLKKKFKALMGYPLNLDNPTTFNEKLQWLKLYNRRDEYTTMVDKYAAKKYVADIIGEQYIIPTLGVWDKYDDINFDSLPNQFVLKCTHNSGGIVICQDKTTFNKLSAKREIQKALKGNYYWRGREWPYKNVKPRIIAEQYMSENGETPKDFKIHNFNGVPRLILVCGDRFQDSGLTEDFYTEEWEHLDIKRPAHNNATNIEERPAELEKMLELAKELSKNIPFVRTDFYIINHKIYFGELTFYPASGFSGFVPSSYDDIFGDWLTISKL